MRFTLLALATLAMASCSHRPHGPKPMTHADSVRRAAEAATNAYLADMDKVRDTLDGPTDPGTGSGEVVRGDKYKTNLLDDSTVAITTSFEKLNARIQKSQKDSTTIYGRLISRFKALDSEHKYLAATYTSEGHLLTFHSEITRDDKHELDCDFYFDKGVLRYFRERRTYTLEDDDQDILSDDSYLMSGSRVLYCYRDEGHAQRLKDHMDLMHLSRYALRGDVPGHVYRAYRAFLSDYDILLGQPMEMMVYTPPVRVPVPEPPKPPSKGFSF